jgi:dolichol-phosphate mannosyltransferase
MPRLISRSFDNCATPPSRPRIQHGGLDLSVVIPVCNEADNVASLCAELRHWLGSLDYELVFVDDGSTDGTAAKLARLRDAMPQLRLVRHAANAGQSAALLTGVRAARAAWVATLDGDGQNDPEDVLRLWRLARRTSAPAGLYIGHRISRRDGRLRIVSSWIANAVRSRLLRDHVSDTGCGIKLFRRDVFLSLPYFDHMHRFMPALVRREGLEVITFPVAHRHRLAGASKYGVRNRLWVGLVDLVGVMWLLRRRYRGGPTKEAGDHGS